jgi:hypothetical protein
LYNIIAAKLRSEEKIVMCITSYGIDALLLDVGRTTHSTFKLPIQINEDSICAIDKTSNRAYLLHKTSLIIWDEVPLQHHHCSEVVDHMLHDLRDDGRTFGNVIIMFGGDFCQILLLTVKGFRGQIVVVSLCKSMFWHGLHLLKL